MTYLKEERPDVHQRFEDGLYVIRTCSRLWAGLVLCYNWQFPIQGNTPMPQWPNGGGGFRVGGGVHDSYTFQCGLVEYFTSPGIDTRIEWTDGC